MLSLLLTNMCCTPSTPSGCSIHAVLNDKREAVELLLGAGADVTATTRAGDTALHWASYKVDGVQGRAVWICCSHGPAPCSRPQQHGAANHAPMPACPIVACLLFEQSRASISTQTQGYYECAQMLIENAANLEAVGDLGNRPLHLAASAGHTRVRGMLGLAGQGGAEAGVGWPLHLMAYMGKRREVAVKLSCLGRDGDGLLDSLTPVQKT